MRDQQTLSLEGDLSYPTNTAAARARTQPRVSVRLLFYGLAILLAVLIVAGMVALFELDGQPGMYHYSGSRLREVNGLPVDVIKIDAHDGGSIWLTAESLDGLLRFDYHDVANGVVTFYSVRAGDTLASIGDKFEVREDEITESNDGIHADADLEVGEWVRVPAYRHYTREDFGTEEDAVGEAFTVLHGHAWVVADDTVLRYFAGEWQHLGRLEGPAAAIVSWSDGDGFDEVFVAERSGRLHILTPETHEVMETGEVAAMLAVEGLASESAPELAVMREGLLVYKYDVLALRWGEAWLRVEPPDGVSLADMRLIGCTLQQVWFAQGQQLWRLDPYTQEWQHGAPPDLNLPAGTDYIAVDTSESHTWLLTSAGLWRDAGAGWEKTFQPAELPRGFALRYGYEAWVAVEGQEALLGDSFPLAVGVAGILLGTVLLGVAHLAATRLPALQKAVDKDTDAPSTTLLSSEDDADEEEDRWLQISLIFFGIVVAAIIGLVLLLVWGADTMDNLEALVASIDRAFEEVWPNPPDLVEDLVEQAAFTLILLVLALPGMILSLLLGGGSRKRLKRIGAVLGLIITLFLFTSLEVFIDHFGRAVDDEGSAGEIIAAVLTTCVGTGLLFGGAGLLFSWLRGTPIDVNGKIRRGMYDEAIEQASGVGQMGNFPHAAWMYGTALLLAGRFEQAVEQLQHSIELGEEKRNSQKQLYNSLENLGMALTALGRYEEAGPALDQALELNPASKWAHVRRAELLLHEGREPERALAELETAEGLRRTPDEQQLAPEILMNKAWALAMLGRQVEADEMLTQAFAKLKRPNQPIEAGLNWRAGMAMLARRDRHTALAYFERVLVDDPAGPYAERARNMRERANAIGGGAVLPV